MQFEFALTEAALRDKLFTPHSQSFFFSAKESVKISKKWRPNLFSSSYWNERHVPKQHQNS